MIVVMDSETKNTETLAVFIDVANSYREVDYVSLLRDLAARGRIVEKNAIADFSRTDFLDVQRILLTCGVRMIHVPGIPNSHGWKTIDDQWLAKEVRDCLERRPDITTYVLVSGDGDFVPLVASLRDHEKKVIVVSSRRPLSNLLRACLWDDDELRLVG